MRAQLTFPVCATVLIALLSGCGLFDKGDANTDEEEDDVKSGSPPDSEEVVGDGTFPYHGTEGEVTVEINSLTERGDLLQMDYTITPGTPESDAFSQPTLRRLFGADHGENMYLVDTANLRRHVVVEDDNGKNLEAHPWNTDLPYDEPTQLTAFFASAEDMETVDVYLYGLPPIMEVPVTTPEEDTDE